MSSPRIDADLAARLVAAQFPQWSHLAIRPVAHGGHDNRTFHLGPDLSVRLPSAAHYALQAQKEQRWLPRLAPALPLPIPEPVALGEPGEGFPWRWSVVRWLEGETAERAPIPDRVAFAADLGRFLAALHRADAAEAPAPGPHNFHRGGPPGFYDDEVRQSLAALAGQLDTAAGAEVWQAALTSTWADAPVWVHGDVGPGNLLVRDSRLSAVIDFGCCGVGDPACDLAIAWTYFQGPARAAFRAAVALDEDTWARARGWALWKALIILARPPGLNLADHDISKRVVEAVIQEHRAGR